MRAMKDVHRQPQYRWPLLLPTISTSYSIRVVTEAPFPKKPVSYIGERTSPLPEMTMTFPFSLSNMASFGVNGAILETRDP